MLTALNLTNFAEYGPLPSDHIPKGNRFVASQLSPFATNLQVQSMSPSQILLCKTSNSPTSVPVLSCASKPEDQIRLIINDGVTPLTGIKGCPSDADGMCPLSTFVAAQQELLEDADWEWECHGDWEVPAGKAWNTTTGTPPRRPTKSVYGS